MTSKLPNCIEDEEYKKYALHCALTAVICSSGVKKYFAPIALTPLNCLIKVLQETIVIWDFLPGFVKLMKVTIALMFKS